MSRPQHRGQTALLAQARRVARLLRTHQPARAILAARRLRFLQRKVSR